MAIANLYYHHPSRADFTEFLAGSDSCGPQGKGRDPPTCNNYRGITLTSVFSKCLQVIILECLESLFIERGFPHPSETAYQRGLSCIDAVFSTQEVIIKHIREGDTPYLCFFDLEKAFDSVKYHTLLSHIWSMANVGESSENLSPTAL